MGFRAPMVLYRVGDRLVGPGEAVPFNMSEGFPQAVRAHRYDYIGYVSDAITWDWPAPYRSWFDR